MDNVVKLPSFHRNILKVEFKSGCQGETYLQQVLDGELKIKHNGSGNILSSTEDQVEGGYNITQDGNTVFIPYHHALDLYVLLHSIFSDKDGIAKITNVLDEEL